LTGIEEGGSTAKQNKKNGRSAIPAKFHLRHGEGYGDSEGKDREEEE